MQDSRVLNEPAIQQNSGVDQGKDRGLLRRKRSGGADFEVHFLFLEGRSRVFLSVIELKQYGCRLQSMYGKLDSINQERSALAKLSRTSRVAS